MIINLTYHQFSENVIEVIFHGWNHDWFAALFPMVDVDRATMTAYYVGRDFYHTKKEYEGRILVEGDILC
jgi:hypothetical protein